MLAESSKKDTNFYTNMRIRFAKDVCDNFLKKCQQSSLRKQFCRLSCNQQRRMPETHIIFMCEPDTAVRFMRKH